jgi:hypothetical protein
MERTEIIIRITNDRIYFNPSLSIIIQHTDIPRKHLTFNSNRQIYWTIEQLEYLPDDKCLRARITDYNTADVAAFEKQEPKKEVAHLLFGSFDWQKLEPQLSVHQKIKFLDKLSNAEQKLIERESPSLPKQSKPGALPSRPAYLLTPTPVRTEFKPTVTKVNEEFWVRFADARFGLWFISFKKHIKRFGREFELKVVNAHLRPEFESIKPWFEKKLQTKRFRVILTITQTDNGEPEIVANSAQIDQITPDVIDSVRDLRTLALTRDPRVAVADPLKSLFNAEEIFSQVDTNDNGGNVFQLSEEDILKTFLEKGDIRNKKQLEYLAGKRQTINQKLRYTIKPNFGFLFFIEGAHNNHYVWELLKSHATYIWSFKKGVTDVGSQFKSVENEINFIKIKGRENYKRGIDANTQDSGHVFSVVPHDGISSGTFDSFSDWKNKLNDRLG